MCARCFSECTPEDTQAGRVLGPPCRCVTEVFATDSSAISPLVYSFSALPTCYEQYSHIQNVVFYMIDDTLSNALADSRYICMYNKKCVCNLCSLTVSFSRAIFSASCFLKAGILEKTLGKKSVLYVIFGVSSMIHECNGEDRFNLRTEVMSSF